MLGGGATGGVGLLGCGAAGVLGTGGLVDTGGGGLLADLESEDLTSVWAKTGEDVGVGGFTEGVAS